jgi:hypothetical protein
MRAAREEILLAGTLSFIFRWSTRPNSRSERTEPGANVGTEQPPDGVPVDVATAPSNLGNFRELPSELYQAGITVDSG